MFINSENGNASDVTSINWLYKPKKNSIFLDSDDRYFSNDTNYIDDTISHQRKPESNIHAINNLASKCVVFLGF